MTMYGSETPSALTPEQQSAQTAEQKVYAGFGTVLIHLAERYTGLQSCTIPEEQAEQLLRSIVFAVQAVSVLDNIPLERLLGSDLQQTWQHGVGLLQAKQRSILVDLKLLMQENMAVRNSFYTDALRNIAENLTKYDAIYNAHRTPSAGSEYELLCPVPETRRGLFFTDEYIRRLQRECDFLVCFPLETRAQLYRTVYAEPEDTAFNLCEPCLFSALALTLLHRDAKTLSVPADTLPRLTELITGRTGEELSLMLENASDRLCDALKLSDEGDRAYLREAAASAAPRLAAAAQAGNLGLIFPEIPV